VTKAVITVQRTSTTRKRQATSKPAKSRAWKWSASSMNRRRRRWLTGLEKKSDETIAVYDLGGGTSTFRCWKSAAAWWKWKSTNGDTHLGGDDVDQKIVDWLIDEFKKEHGIDLGKDKMALQRLKEAAEKAKIELSQMMETEINLPFITAGASGPIHMQQKLTRMRLEQLMSDLLERSTETSEACSGRREDVAERHSGSGAGRRVHANSEGAATGQARSLAQELHKGVNPDEVVAVGAAISGRGASAGSKGHPAARRDVISRRLVVREPSNSSTARRNRVLRGIARHHRRHVRRPVKAASRRAAGCPLLPRRAPRPECRANGNDFIRFTPLCSSLPPKNVLTSCCTFGIRVDPPTSTTS